MKLAITGGTGFVGGRLLDAAADRGHEVRALTRRARRPRVGIEWIAGDLDDTDALRKLADGADAVIHVAGVLTGRTREDFDQCNVLGTQNMIEAAQAGGVKRFVHVSSLAAREPDLSLYGGSKARSEELVAASPFSWAIVRPPAVYGPGDKETFELFRMARLGILLLPPSGRVSLIHVDDLVALLLALAQPTAPTSLIVEPDDARSGGWTHKELAQSIGRAVLRRCISISVPKPVLRAAAFADQLIRRDNAKLTADRAAYFSHPDWVVDPARAAPPELWRPQIETEEGLFATADWYRERRWL